MKDGRTAVYEAIDAHLEQHVTSILEMIRQPSISATGEGVPEMADMLVRRISALGGNVRRISTRGNPIVYGDLDAGARKTVLFYLLYDVQPADDQGWMVPPFNPQVVKLPQHGPSIVGRGAFNSKGPLGAFLNVLESFKNSGEPFPVNIVFLIEGEEELGSPSLPAFVSEHSKELMNCDAVFQPYFGQNSGGQPLIYLGCKGLVYLEMVCRSGDWGGPCRREIHALHNSWIGNPAWRLVQALASLKEPGLEERTAVPGWYDRAAGLPAFEEGVVRKLAQSFDPAVPLNEQDCRRYKLPASAGPRQLLEAYLWEPSLNIDGLYSGYQGGGTKTVIPHAAAAKLDIRLVPEMVGEEQVELLRHHLDDRGFDDIEINVLSSVPWSSTDPDSPPMRAFMAAIEEHCSVPTQVWPRSGGMVPHHLFTRNLKLPVVFGGLGHGGRAHSTNEYITVEGLRAHEKCTTSFLYNLAGRNGG